MIEQFIFVVGATVCLLVGITLLLLFSMGVTAVVCATVATGWEALVCAVRFSSNPFSKSNRSKYSLWRKQK